MDPSPISQDEIIRLLRTAGCVFAEEEAALLVSAATSPAHLRSMVNQRVGGRPLEAIVGWAGFCGLRVLVDDGVFVPRRRTEFLVETAVHLTPTDAVVLDLCCGTGAVGVAIAARVPGIELHAADIDEPAVACTRRNLLPIGGTVHHGDLYDALPTRLRHQVAVIVVNAPYVPTDAIVTMPSEARLFEPAVALDGGADGLDVQRRVAADATRWLFPGGALLIETSDEQSPLTAALLQQNGLITEVRQSDEFDATVVIGRAPAP